MFLIFHCVNIAVLLTAAWFYLHPFESVRPTMLWIGAAHAIAFASFMMVACQVLLFEFNPNPPMDTDGRREDTGREVRKLQAR